MNYWQGKNIRLRAIESSDVSTLVEWDLHSEIGRYMHFTTPPQSEAAIRAFVEKEELKKLEDDRYFWIIESLEGVAVGYIDTRTDPRHGTFEYGVSVIPDYKRKGYASEAIMMVVAYYFDHLRYQKVTAGAHSDNQPSIELHKRLGFKHEGTHRNMVYREGSYVDTLYFGMTVAEFRTR